MVEIIEVLQETVTPDECTVRIGAVELTFRRGEPGPRGGKGKLRRTATSAPQGVETFLPRSTFLKVYHAAIAATINATYEQKHGREIGRKIGLL